MTSASDHRHTMKMLTKVARGLDLPPPEVSTPPLAAAPLTDEETVVDQRLDETIAAAAPAGTASDQARAPLTELPAGDQHPLETLQVVRGSGSASGRPTAVSDPTMLSENLPAGVASAVSSATENTGTESALSGLLPAAGSSPRQFPPADSRAGKATAAETTAPDPARPFETSADTATDPLNTGDLRITQTGSPEAAAGLTRSISREATEAPRGPGHRSADDTDPALVENTANSGTRWQLYRAGKPAGKAFRQTSRMLQPVFEIPEQAGAPQPAEIRQRENPIARDRAPAADHQPGLTTGPARTAGGEMADRRPHHQPAVRTAKPEPAGSQKAILPLNGTSSPANRPPATASHAVAASNRQRPNRRPDRKAVSIGQAVPGEARASSGPDQPAGAAAVQEKPGAKAGGVSVGRINIQVRGQRQTEDDWPEPPQYISHSITADWEWSCHYGR